MIFSLECDWWRYHRLYMLWQHIDLWHYPILFCKITVLLTQESILCCTHGDLRHSFSFPFPYSKWVVEISTQRLCVTIKCWLPGSRECFLANRLFFEKFLNFFVAPIFRYTVLPASALVLNTHNLTSINHIYEHMYIYIHTYTCHYKHTWLLSKRNKSLVESDLLVITGLYGLLLSWYSHVTLGTGYPVTEQSMQL